MALTRSVVSLSAVTKMTGMRAVRGSRLMRRHTSKPAERSSTPRSPAGMETSRMQRSGISSKHVLSADGPSDAAIARNPRTWSWSKSSSTLAGTSSATRMTGASAGGGTSPVMRSGAYCESYAEGPCGFRQRRRRRAVGMQERQVERRPATSANQRAGAPGKRLLIHTRRPDAEGQGAPAHTGAHTDRVLAKPRAEHVGTDARVPGVADAQRRRSERRHARPRFVRGPHRKRRPANADVGRAQRDAVMHMRHSNSVVTTPERQTSAATYACRQTR